MRTFLEPNYKIPLNSVRKEASEGELTDANPSPRAIWREERNIFLKSSLPGPGRARILSDGCSEVEPEQVLIRVHTECRLPNDIACKESSEQALICIRWTWSAGSPDERLTLPECGQID